MFRRSITRSRSNLRPPAPPAAAAQLWQAVRSCVEPLESRALLSATIAADDIDAETSNHVVEVRYSDPEGVDAASIDENDLSVNGPKPVGVTLDKAVQDGADVVATYVLAGPGGSWDRDDNGGYSVSVNAGAVKDTGGNDVETGGTASFTVAVPPPADNTGPSVSISANDVTAGGGGTHTVQVTYSDDSGIDASSIGTSNVSVTRGGSSLNVIDAAVAGSGNSRTVTYTFQAPGGSWDAGDNGAYTVTVNAGAVKDASPAGNGSEGKSAQFGVNVAPPPDTDGPSASIAVGNVGAATGTHTATVSYVDDRGLNIGSLGLDDVSVSGGVSVTNFNVTAGEDGKSASVVYTLTGPGGSFDSADNGSYTVSLNGANVRDAAGNAASGSSAGFSVNITPTPPVDDTAPTAAVSPIGNVTTAGVASVDVVVTYTDETGMDAGSIGASDLDVSRTGGGGGGNLGVSLKSAQASPDGKTVVATYTVAAPGGSFDAADNGGYAVTVRNNQVRDAAGNAAAAASGGFQVSVPGSGPVDALAPVAAITAGDVTTAGGATHAVTVVYTDDAAVDVSTIGAADLTVTGPGGAALAVTGFNPVVSAGGKVVTVTYNLAAPGGSFDAADNGAYTVSLNADAVRDTAGRAAAPVSAGFGVSLAAAPPPDEAGPAVAISAPDITAPGGTTQTVTVTYTDDGKMRPTSVGPDDLVVTGPGGVPLVVTGVTTTASNGGGTVTAVYTLAAPGGKWDTPDNGAYTISLAPGAVLDTKGNGNAAAGAAFGVNATVVDGAAPTIGGIATLDVSAEAVTTQVVTVAYADDVALDLTSIGTDDLTVSGPGGSLAVNVISVATSADGKGAIVTYTFAAPGGAFTTNENGTYTINVNPGAVTDAAGKGVGAASRTFQVAVPVQPTVDPGFGSGSPVVTSFVAEAVGSSDSTGKVLVAGRSGNNAVLEVRNANGTLDTTFNKTGQVVSTIDTAYYAVVAQGDKVIVAGTMGGDFVLVRYLADGRIDSSFGSGGRMVVDFGQPNDAAYALTIAPDGKLIAVGQSDGNFAVARYGADGRLDPSFATGGMALIDLGASDLAGAVAVQSDGKVVIAGTSGANVAVVRLQANGLDDSAALGSASPFSGDGLLMIGGLVARVDASLADRSTALAIQPDGRILVGNHTAGGDFGVARITAAGNVDSSFGNDGVATADFGGADDADALIVQPTGEILAVGTSLTGSTGRITLAAFSASGELIEGFGDDGTGKLTLDSGMVASGRELHVGDLVLRAFGTRQSDGRVVVGTTNSAPQQQSQSALRRLNVPGTRSVAAGSAIGTFGNVVNGRVQKLTYTDADGTRMTFAIKGGTGTLFLGADGKLNLAIQDGGAGTTVTVKGKGGDGRIAFGDVTSNGTINSMSVKNGDLSGTFCTGGGIGKLTLGNVTGSICSAGNITTLTAAGLTNAKLLAGANLGTDGAFGGTGANTDAYGAGTIGTLKVGGQIVNSTVGAGLDPVDSTFLDDDDRVIGGAAQSNIRSITAKGADDASRFLSGAFGKVKLGAKVTPATDPRFRVLA